MLIGLHAPVKTERDGGKLDSDAVCGFGSAAALGLSCRRRQKHGKDEQIQDRKYDANATNPPIALQKPYASNKTR
jgi:hypothetical protein